MLQGQHKVGVLSLQFCQVGGVVDRHAHPLIAHGAKEGAPKQQLLLISGGADHSVCLWDVMSSSCLHRLTCHAAPVTCVRTMGDVIVTVAGMQMRWQVQCRYMHMQLVSTWLYWCRR